LVGRGCATDPAGGAYSGPPDPLAGGVEAYGTKNQDATHASALRSLGFGPSGFANPSASVAVVVTSGERHEGKAGMVLFARKTV